MLLKAQEKANGEEDDVNLGEVRFDPATGQATLLMKRELDP